MKFAFIEAEKAALPRAGCCVGRLGVSRAGFYAWQHAPAGGAHRSRTRGSAVEIPAIHAESRQRYGSPRVHAELRDRGRRRGRKRVARLMREQGCGARRRRRFRTTTDSHIRTPWRRTCWSGNFAVAAPNTAWVTDITYIWTREGWLYLAVILDLFSRRVVGWAMSARSRRSTSRCRR